MIAIGGISNKTQVGDMAIDGRIVSATAKPKGKTPAFAEFLDRSCARPYISEAFSKSLNPTPCCFRRHGHLRRLRFAIMTATRILPDTARLVALRNSEAIRPSKSGENSRSSDVSSSPR